MISRMWLFGLLLAVPLIGFLVAEGIQEHFNAELRSAFLKQLPGADPVIVANLTLDRLCEDNPSEFRDICSTNDNLNLMSGAAVSAGLVGLLLLLVIRVAGSLARGNRRLLLWLFKPGLYLTGLVLVGLVVVHAGVAMGAIYYGESTLIGRIHVGIIGAIALGALVGVIAIARNAFSLVRKAQTVVIGKALSQNEAPSLWRCVEGIADRLNALHPDNIVLGLDPNFFVTEAEVACLSGSYTGRTLYCSLPLMRILNLKEFEAIVGHELGHYKGLDTKFSQRFFPIYRGTTNAIVELQETGGDGTKAIALLPAIAVFSYFLESFSVAESRISRDRELAADKEGATASDGRSLASALVKVHAFSGFWEGLQYAAVEALKQGKAFINASKAYAEVIAGHAKADALKGLADTHLSHPTDSHPSLASRLGSLGISMDDVETDALNVSPTLAAIELVMQSERLEEEISDAYQVFLARQLGINLDSTAHSDEQGGN
ncbi:Zn-dependent protease with chaperone function [Geothermobacter ehrlichii]|uniref:Zn-dependent protease with chaperone function n=1 Tax=Geothermobacter ehrlichii TaxID=213224 RepID=A0A5D3WPR8_9BACT|nr:M48 family metallopeptidase [Geothermobacter ehrlichii]TYP00354.1 Zn-dependent protease with chaperone function [Geothermobacter ehrlichii]